MTTTITTTAEAEVAVEVAAGGVLQGLDQVRALGHRKGRASGALDRALALDPMMTKAR